MSSSDGSETLAAREYAESRWANWREVCTLADKPFNARWHQWHSFGLPPASTAILFGSVTFGVPEIPEDSGRSHGTSPQDSLPGSLLRIAADEL